MKDAAKPKTVRVKISPVNRLRVLINQRTYALSKHDLITQDFISDMISTSEKQNRASSRTVLLTSIYLAILYIAYSGSGVAIKILGIEFSDVPRLLEISIGMVSLSLFYIGVQLLNQEILRQSIDSMIGSLLPNDEISQSLFKYRSAPIFNFYFLFNESTKNTPETIVPVGITKVFNIIASSIALAMILSIYIIPIIFLLGFAVPSMETSIISIALGFLAWTSSLFLIISFLSIRAKLPYDETILE